MVLNKELFFQLVENGKGPYSEEEYHYNEFNHEMDNTILSIFLGGHIPAKRNPLAIVEIKSPWLDYILVFWDTEEEKTKWCHMGDTLWECVAEEWGLYE